MNKFKHEYKLPVAFLLQEKVSRNIVGERELSPDLVDQLYFLVFFNLIILTFITISCYNPIHSVFWLIMLFISGSIFVIFMGLHFIGIMIIIIYVGAIAILFLFVIMMLDIFQLRNFSTLSNLIPITSFFIFQIIALDFIVLPNFNQHRNVNWSVDIKNHLDLISKLLYDDYGDLLILISFLLLIAMVGAIVLTLEASKNTRRQIHSLQNSRNK